MLHVDHNIWQRDKGGVTRKLESGTLESSMLSCGGPTLQQQPDSKPQPGHCPSAMTACAGSSRAGVLVLLATEADLSAVFARLSSCPGRGGRPSKDGLRSQEAQPSACCAGCRGLPSKEALPSGCSPGNRPPPSCEDQPSREGLPSVDLRREDRPSREGLPPRGRDSGMLDSAEAQSIDWPSLDARENTLPALALL